MRVIWSPSALRAVARVFDYLLAFNPDAAARVVEAIIAAGDGLADFPDRGRQVGQSEMREFVMAYPYIIRYRVARDAVRLLRIRHASRHPTNP